MTAEASDTTQRQLPRGLSILERLGIIDFNGHFSERSDDGKILINSGSSVRSATKFGLPDRADQAAGE